MTDFNTNFPPNTADEPFFGNQNPVFEEGKPLLPPLGPTGTERLEDLDKNGNGKIDYDELGPGTQEAIDQLRVDINSDDLTSTTEITNTGDLVELAKIDGIVTTQVDPGGNLWAFIYPGITSEQARANPDVLLDTAPIIFLSYNKPIPTLANAKPVFSINLNGENGAEILKSFEGGLGYSGGALGGNGFFNVRAGGKEGPTVRGSGGVFWEPGPGSPLKLASSIGTANGVWHVGQAISNGALDALPEEIRDEISAQFGDVSISQEAFITAYGGTAFAVAGRQGIGFAYTGTASRDEFRLNSGELASKVTLAIPNGNASIRLDVNIAQYEEAALDDPFVVDPFNPNDPAKLHNELSHRFALPDPLGETAPPGDRSFASFLYLHYSGQGLQQDEILARIDIDLTGGPGSYEDQIFQLLTDSRPETLNLEAFSDAGFGEIASYPAMATVAKLVQDGATYEDAWTEVARIYADGFGDGSEFEGVGGGFAGGLTALQDNLENVGIISGERFSDIELTDSTFSAPPPLVDTIYGDLVASEITGRRADDVKDALIRPDFTYSGSVDRAITDRIGRIEQKEEITLADGTEVTYIRTDKGNAFVLIDRSTFAERSLEIGEVSGEVYGVSGSTLDQVKAMVLEQNPGDGTNRLVSLVDVNIPSEVVNVPRFTDPNVAVSAVFDPAELGGDGLIARPETISTIDGTTGTWIRYQNADGEDKKGYFQVRSGGQDWIFDRGIIAPDLSRSIVVMNGTSAPTMIQLDNIASPDGNGTIGDRFVEGSIRRQELPNGGTAIYGRSADGQQNVLYIAPGGGLRLLDTTNFAEDTVIDTLLREGSSVLPQDVLAPRGDDGVEFTPFNGGAFLIPERKTLVVADKDGVRLIDTPDNTEQPAPSSLTGPSLRFQQDMQSLLYDADGNERGIYTPEQASDIAYSNYQLYSLDGDTEGFTNDAYRDSRFESRSAYATPLDRDAYNTVFDAEFDRLAPLIVPAQTGNAEARAELEAAGITFLPDGRIDSSTGGAVAQISRAAADTALDPKLNAAVAARGTDVSPAEVGEVIESIANGTANLEFLNDISALRGQVTAQIADLGRLGGNESAIAFLRSFDLALGAIELAGGDFSGTAIGEFLSSGSGSIGFFLSKIGTGDAAAWSAFSADLGGFVASLTDGQRDTLRQEAYSFSLAGSFLLLAGSSGTQPNDAAIISGELLTIIGDGLLAAAGEIPAGFETVTTPEFAIGSGFGRLLGRYADRTDTPIDDIGAILLEDGLPAWDALKTGSVVNSAGEQTFNGTLAGSAILASAGGAILNELIGGDAGRILQAVGDGASTGILLAAGSINPVQAVIAGVDAFFDAVGIEVPPEAQLGAMVAIAAANASNPIGWVALAVQVVFQFASMRDFTVVTEIAPGIDADGDLSFDDSGQLSTDFNTNFWGSTSATGGRLEYDVVSPNDLRLQTATFDLIDDAVASLKVRNDRDEGLMATLTVNGEDIDGSIRSKSGEVSFSGYSRAGRDRNIVKNATFVSDDGSIEVPVRVYDHGSNDDDNRAGARFDLKPEALDILPPNYRVAVSGVYDPINPGVGVQSFEQIIDVSPQEYAQLEAELGSTDAVTLDGANPLIGGPLNPDAPVTTIQQVMDRVEVTFEGAERGENLYQYLDMNGDGNPDLVRYGISADGDGLNSGDERYEVTLLGPNLSNLNLPTIVHPDINEAANIASLAPYLFQWAAARPDVYQHGLDPVSIMNVAAERGDLDGLTELRSLDLSLASDLSLMSQTLSQGDTVTDQIWADVQGAIQTNENTTARRQELMEMLDLFDPKAYGDANTDLVPVFNGNGMQLAHHYMAYGNTEGRAIDTDGTILEVGAQPVWSANQSVGTELRAGEQLLKNQMLVSDNGDFAAQYTDRGKLQIVDLSGAEPNVVWQADTGYGNDNDGTVVMQQDGNLAIYEEDGDVVFSTDTNSVTGPTHGNFALRLENDGRLVIHDQIEGDILWSAGASVGGATGDGVFVRRAIPGDAPAGAIATESADALRSQIMFNDADAFTYLASDIALVEAYNNVGGDPVLWARQQFEAVGQFGEVSLDFDPELYISAPGNDDLYIAFADDPDGATQHFVTMGFAEKQAGQRAQVRLDSNDVPNQTAELYDTIMDTRGGALAYVASSPSLTEAYLSEGGDPVEWARSHFETVGWQSEVTLDFDARNYISAPGNDDLAGAYWNDPIGALEHYIQFGYTESATSDRQLMLAEGDEPNAAAELIDRVMSSDVDALTYIASSPDLVQDIANTGVTDLVSYARSHVTTTGWQENRPMDFNTEGYLWANTDLGEAFGDDLQAGLTHYITLGHAEPGRVTWENSDQSAFMPMPRLIDPTYGPVPDFEPPANPSFDAIFDNVNDASPVYGPVPDFEPPASPGSGTISGGEADADPTGEYDFDLNDWLVDGGLNEPYDRPISDLDPETVVYTQPAYLVGTDPTAPEFGTTIDPETEVSHQSATPLDADPAVASNVSKFIDAIAEAPTDLQSVQHIFLSVLTTSEGALTYLASDVELVRQYQNHGGDPVIWARNHFQQVGQFDQPSLDFDPQRYIAAPGNEDLVVAFWDDPEGAIAHFVTHGLAEKDAGTREQVRLDPNDVPNQASVIYEAVMTTDDGALSYIASSPDLVADVRDTGVTDLVGYARTHLETHGWAENRSLDVDGEAYLAENPELAETLSGNPVAGLEHYIRLGDGLIGRVSG